MAAARTEQDSFILVLSRFYTWIAARAATKDIFFLICWSQLIIKSFSKTTKKKKNAHYSFTEHELFKLLLYSY